MELENIDTLKKLGLTEENQWILYDDNLGVFLSWINTNIDEANMLTALEIKEYDDLPVKYLYSELSDVLKDIEKELPDYNCNVDSDDIDGFSETLKALQETEDMLKNQNELMNNTYTEQQKILDYLNQSDLRLDCEIETLSPICSKKAASLTELQTSNQKDIQLLNQCYLQNQGAPLFVYQMPLDVFHSQCDVLLNYLEIYIKQNFHCNQTRNETDEKYEKICSKLLECRKRLSEIEKKLISEQMSISGMRNILDQLSNKTANLKIENDLIKAATGDILNDNEFKKLILNALNDEIANLIDEVVEQRVILLLHEYSKHKSEYATDHLEKIIHKLDVVQDGSLISELLWMLMQLDLDKLKKKYDNTDEIALEGNNCLKRMKLMHLSCKRDLSINDLLTQILCKQLKWNLYIDRDQSPELSTCLVQLFEILDNDKTQVLTASKANRYNEINTELVTLETNMSSLKSFVFDGPTNQPQLIDSHYSIIIHETFMKIKFLQSLYSKFKNNYQRKVIDPMNNNNFFRYKNLLWIWFLTEPNKILHAIKDIQSAAFKNGTASYKALGIKIKE